ncbi:MAG: fumarylacetoacetate hydrolase family protein [Halobacteriaceae archaeon]
MRYYHVDGHLLARDGDATFDVTAGGGPDSLGALLREAADVGTDLDAAAAAYREDAPEAEVADDGADLPLVPGEVWAAGVTYAISEEAREAESTMPDMYMNVYEAERPEIFFKATPSRTVGPSEAVGIRADSDWDVPEPELGIVLHEGDIVGFTVGNDMSSRDIEGQNPLYLPQAKVYDRCCSLGPAVVAADDVDPHDLEMSIVIERDGEVVFEDRTSTGEMKRSVEELASYYTRHNAVPELAVLLTGTSLVPPDDFTLREGDAVTIDMEGIGTLANPVVEV